MSGTIRLSDIAARLGVSKNTVSLALRDSPRIPEPTRLRIRTLADELNYTPNHIAKALTSRETKTIGLVLADISNPVLTETSKIIEQRLKALGFSMIFASSNNDLGDEVAAIRMFRERQVDGALVYPMRPQAGYPHVETLRRAGFPLVLVVPGRDVAVDLVGADEFAGAYMATTHLAEQGYREIGVIDGDNTRGNRDKIEGYLKALADAGIAFRPAWHATPPVHSPAGGFAAMRQLLADTAPRAVFVASDYLGIGAMHCCLKAGLRVPQDIALVGFDNIALAEFLPTPLSSVDYDIDCMAQLAIERLLTLIAAPDIMPEPCVRLIEPRLIVRESSRTAIAPPQSQLQSEARHQ